MRSLNDERGAIAVTVAFLMVALIGFAALAIDVSALYQERRTLQNGADAGALAVAKDCAGTSCGGFNGKANRYADENADDGNSNVDEVCGLGPGLIDCIDDPPVPAGTVGYVRVTTSTYQVSSPDNPTEVNFNFAPVFDLVAPGDHDGKTMRAKAVAAWGPPRSAATLPLTLSDCEYDEHVPTLADLKSPPFNPAEEVVIFFHGSGEAGVCDPRTPSGQDLPGGFGWLDGADGDCEVTVTVEQWAPSDPGNSRPGCLNLRSLVGTTVLLPVHKEERGTGRSGQFLIEGFAGFHLTGYRFGGDNVGGRCPGASNNGATCIRGHFTSFSTTGPVFGGPDMGVKIIKLVG
jgi:hypothetical protein